MAKRNNLDIIKIIQGPSEVKIRITVNLLLLLRSKENGLELLRYFWKKNSSNTLIILSIDGLKNVVKAVPPEQY